MNLSTIHIHSLERCTRVSSTFTLSGPDVNVYNATITMDRDFDGRYVQCPAVTALLKGTVPDAAYDIAPWNAIAFGTF